MHWKTIISTKCCIQPSCNTPHRSSCPSRQNVTYSHLSTYRYHNKIHSQNNFLNNLNVLLTLSKFNNKIPTIYNKIQQLINKMCNNNHNNELPKWVSVTYRFIINQLSHHCQFYFSHLQNQNKWASVNTQ